MLIGIGGGMPQSGKEERLLSLSSFFLDLKSSF
jgi:hypothetical protein